MQGFYRGYVGRKFGAVRDYIGLICRLCGTMRGS